MAPSRGWSSVTASGVQRGDMLFVVDSPETEQRLAQAQQAAAAHRLRSTCRRPRPAPARRQAAAAAAGRSTRRATRPGRSTTGTCDSRRCSRWQPPRRSSRQRRPRRRRRSTRSTAVSPTLEQSLAAFTQAQQVQAQAAVGAAQRAVDELTVRAPIAGPGRLRCLRRSGGGGDDLSGLVDQLPSSMAGQAESLLGGGWSVSSEAAAPPGSSRPAVPVSDGDPILTITDTSSCRCAPRSTRRTSCWSARGSGPTSSSTPCPVPRYRAVVRNVDLSPTTSSRGGVSYVVRLDLGGGTLVDGSPAPRPRPGMSAVASLRVLTSEDVVAVPVAAVFRDGEQDAVWVVSTACPRSASSRSVPRVRSTWRSPTVSARVRLIVVRGADQVVAGEELP